MDIKPRKAVKKSKITRKPEEIRSRAGENGHKAEKSREKVQTEREARGKYGAEQEKMDIKPRKAVKKSKILRKPKRNTEPGRRKWT